MKTGKRIGGAVLLVLAAIFTASRFGAWELRQLTHRVNQLEEEKAQLVKYAERLSASQRVAQINVLNQRQDEFGRPVTVLRWQEISSDGVLGAPSTAEVLGKQIYVESLVIKFQHKHVGNADEGRSTSVAMFRRIFGDYQTPQSAPDLDRYHPPPTGQNDLTTLAPDLWDRFWEMVDDVRTADRYGVRVAQCEAPSVLMSTGQVWEVTLDAAGGVNLKRLADGTSVLARSRN